MLYRRVLRGSMGDEAFAGVSSGFIPVFTTLFRKLACLFSAARAAFVVGFRCHWSDCWIAASISGQKGHANRAFDEKGTSTGEK